MRQPVARAVIALTALLATIFAGSTAHADQGINLNDPPTTSAPSVQTETYQSVRCTYYANSQGFGAWCGGGVVGPIRTWRQRLAGRGPFIPCRDYRVPKGIRLPPPPEGKSWRMRVYMVDFKLDAPRGGQKVHLEQQIVPVGAREARHCRDVDYMDTFWGQFDTQYPPPVLYVEPNYTPRVNVPTYFALAPGSAISNPNDAFNGNEYQQMRAHVVRMQVDPGDGKPKFTCPVVTQAYDQTKGPDEQTGTCKHTYARSSASQPDQTYHVRLSIFWEVRYWSPVSGWNSLGVYEVKAEQRLPVQEVQAVGGR